MAITVTDYQPDEAMAIDTWINSAAPTTNYGTSDTMTIGGGGTGTQSYRWIIGFNWIFEKYLNRKIKFTSDLILNMDAIGGNLSSKYHDCYFIKRDFVESEVTWNNWKSGNAWQTAGGLGANDVDATPTVSSNVTWSAGWHSILIPAGFLEQCRVGKYFGLLFTGWEGYGGDANSAIATSSNATTANRPKYTFSYEPYHKIYMVKSSLGQVK